MFDTNFKSTEVYVEDLNKIVRISLPSGSNEYIDYVDDDVYRSIDYDTSERNISERKHGKDIAKTFRRSANRNDIFSNV